MSEKTTINQKLKNLDDRIEWFYSDDFKLEDAIAKYEDATSLAKEIEKDLDELKNQIEIINQDFTK